MSDGVEILDIGDPERPRTPLRTRHALLRGVAVAAVGLLVVALVTVATIRWWDQRHTFSPAESKAALNNELGRVSASTKDDLQAGDPQLEPARCSAVLTLGLDDALDGASWYSLDGRSSTASQVLLGRYADPRTARHAHTRLHDAVKSCDGVDAHARAETLGDGTTVSYTTTVEASGLRDRLGLSTRWTLRVHQGDEEGIVLHVVAHAYGNVLLVGLDQQPADVPSTGASAAALRQVSARLSRAAADR